MKRSQKAGLAALIGAGIAGGLAYWKYKTMSPEEKEQLKNRVNNAGNKLKKTTADIERSISDKYAELKNMAS
ncbi:YtxH domain-containing protein [Rasiella rasia]|uniref:YtxH domain-containing protein n=1 Tax=Rasiella rasia TaxID=2744027 RepID=A0A6G6GIQ1_9FLAO|nr:YtxH domain-containing protein [Rasiella rasia]QIE58429.1 YtxH domain-containing protein [Rasiella rasia]